MSEMEMVLFSTENKLKVGSKNKTSNTRSVVWQCSHGGHEGFYTLCDSKLKATIDIRNTSASFGHVLDFGLNE
eukprot:Pgem_evm1s14751